MKRTAIIFLIISMVMVLASCMKQGMEASGSPDASIENFQWYLTEVGGKPVSPLAGDRQPHILLDRADGQAKGFAGCNSFFGSYELDGTSLTFSRVGATRMACPDLETGLETAVFDALEKTRTWQKEDNEMLLRDGSTVLARFSTKKFVSLVGPVWQWTQTLYNNDSKIVPENPENYTVQFQAGGAISIKADCNRKGGTYSSLRGEKSIAINITHSTMAACPEGSLEGEFEKGLSAVAIFFLRDGDLYVDLKYDSGTMRFTKAIQPMVTL